MSEATATPTAAPVAPKNGYWWGTGRRKTAIARVRIKPGSGKFLINDRPMDEFFTEPQHRLDADAALRATDMVGKLDVFVRAHGGGITGQAGAVKLGLARAIKGYDPVLEPALRDHGLLTRDAREVERKKYGQSGARRRFQFSKR
jgi:small subunit ribosomal protein S9